MRSLLLAATALSVAVPALAQDAEAPQPLPVAPEERAEMDTIIVTARKRAETIEDIPLAITALGTEEIRSARIERLSDLAKQVSSLNFVPLFGAQNQLPIIRGAAQTFGVSNVGVFLDGVYLSGKAGVDIEMNDLERIEVVKGPQSALYGRNTFAGAINYVTKRPSDVWSGDGEMSFGTNGLFKVIGGVSGPIDELVRIRLNGYYRTFDGWYTSSVDGGSVDYQKDWGLGGKVELQAAPNLLFTLTGTYTKEDSGQPASNTIATNALPGRPAGSPPGTTSFLVYQGELPTIPREGVTVNTKTDPVTGPYGSWGDTFRMNLQMAATLPFADFTTITAYDKRNFDYTFDGDNVVCQKPAGCPTFGFPFVAPFPFGSSSFGTSSSTGYFEDVSQEFRLVSTTEGKFSWLTGFYLYSGKVNSVDRSLNPMTAQGARNWGYPNSIQNTDSWAWFGSGTLRLREVIGLTGELRYEKEKQTFLQGPLNPTAPAGPSTRSFNLKQDFEFVTPRVILDGRFGDNQLVYFSVAKGVKTGGFNTNVNIFDFQRTYGEESSWTYELGLKTSFPERRLTWNLATFFTDWDDQQVACQNPVSAGGSSTQRTYVCNVGQAQIKGVETDFSWDVNDWFSITGNYAFLDAEYTAFVDASLAAILASVGLPPIDYDGKQLPYVPKNAFTLTPRVTFPVVGDYVFNGRMDFYWQSKTWLRAENFAYFDDKTLIDLRLGINNEKYGIQFFINNLTNNNVSTAGVRFFNQVDWFVQSPLVQGANLRQFGVALFAGF